MPPTMMILAAAPALATMSWAELATCFVLSLVAILVLLFAQPSGRARGTDEALAQTYGLLVREGWDKAAEIKNLAAEEAAVAIRPINGVPPATDGSVYVTGLHGGAQPFPSSHRAASDGKYVRRVATAQGDLWFVRFRSTKGSISVTCIEVRRVLALTRRAAEANSANLAYVTSYGGTVDYDIPNDEALFDELAPFLTEVDRSVTGSRALYNFRPGPGFEVVLDPANSNSKSGGCYMSPPGPDIPAEARRAILANLLTGLDQIPS